MTILSGQYRTVVPLGRTVQRVKRLGRPELPLLSMSAAYGVKLRDLSEGRAPSEDLSNYLVVEPGDIVVNKLSVRDGAVGRSSNAGLVSPAYWVLAARPDFDSRFLHYLLRSDIYQAEIARIAKFMPPAQYDVAWEDFRALPVPAVPLDEQRRVCEYLDDQAARIDTLLVGRREQSVLAVSAEQSSCDASVDACGEVYGWASLRRFSLGIEQGWSPVCDNVPAGPGQFGVLKLSAVRRGRFFPVENKAMVEGVPPVASLALHRGDLLVSRANTPDLVGDCAVVPEDFPSLFLCDLLYRVRLSASVPDFFGAALQTTRVRALLRCVARGTSLSMAKLRGEDLLDLPVPKAPYAVRKRLAESIRESMKQTDELVDALDRSAERAVELKRSLITGAVMGEFDVTTGHRQLVNS